jgi:hypothetical protein
MSEHINLDSYLTVWAYTPPTLFSPAIPAAGCRWLVVGVYLLSVSEHIEEHFAIH